MPAKNIYHDAVVEALTADGWTITHDPLRLSFGGKDLFVDLGAERATLGAEREGRRIAVEVQSFLNLSAVRDLQEAVGAVRSLPGASGRDRSPTDALSGGAPPRL
ncbi:MAG TPA: element excision factor XisH family protein [Gemmataceae bacterium]|nr:element excision factor XisH family protein [Gemmataceae bacterium]